MPTPSSTASGSLTPLSETESQAHHSDDREPGDDSVSSTSGHQPQYSQSKARLLSANRRIPTKPFGSAVAAPHIMPTQTDEQVDYPVAPLFHSFQDAREWISRHWAFKESPANESQGGEPSLTRESNGRKRGMVPFAFVTAATEALPNIRQPGTPLNIVRFRCALHRTTGCKWGVKLVRNDIKRVIRMQGVRAMHAPTCESHLAPAFAVANKYEKARLQNALDFTAHWDESEPTDGMSTPSWVPESRRGKGRRVGGGPGRGTGRSNEAAKRRRLDAVDGDGEDEVQRIDNGKGNGDHSDVLTGNNGHTSTWAGNGGLEAANGSGHYKHHEWTLVSTDLQTNPNVSTQPQNNAGLSVDPVPARSPRPHTPPGAGAQDPYPQTAAITGPGYSRLAMAPLPAGPHPSNHAGSDTSAMPPAPPRPRSRASSTSSTSSRSSSLPEERLLEPSHSSRFVGTTPCDPTPAGGLSADIGPTATRAPSVTDKATSAADSPTLPVDAPPMTGSATSATSTHEMGVSRQVTVHSTRLPRSLFDLKPLWLRARHTLGSRRPNAPLFDPHGESRFMEHVQYKLHTRHAELRNVDHLRATHEANEDSGDANSLPCCTLCRGPDSNTANPCWALHASLCTRPSWMLPLRDFCEGVELLSALVDSSIWFIVNFLPAARWDHAVGVDTLSMRRAPSSGSADAAFDDACFKHSWTVAGAFTITVDTATLETHAGTGRSASPVDDWERLDQVAERQAHVDLYSLQATASESVFCWRRRPALKEARRQSGVSPSPKHRTSLQHHESDAPAGV